MAETLTFDEIGYWSEIKLDIIKDYAAAYSTILAKQRGMTHIYIDGFAGAGVHVSKATGELIKGSPLNALAVTPPFREYFLVDLNGGRVENLRQLIGARSDVHLFEGDCNTVLLKDVLPHVRYEDYRRGLCVLDPYGLHLNWDVIRTAGQMKTIDLFLNFPIADANRNVLWRDHERVPPAQAARLTSYWGDESWRKAAYRPSGQRSLFDDGEEMEKVDNEGVVEAFRQRLVDVAGFNNVPAPIAMRNSTGGIVYYLFFASQKDVANKIVAGIFRKYKDRRG